MRAKMSEEQRYSIDNKVCNRLNKIAIILHIDKFLQKSHFSQKIKKIILIKKFKYLSM